MNLKINGSWLYCVEQIPILIVCYLTIHLCYLRGKKIKTSLQIREADSHMY